MVEIRIASISDPLAHVVPQAFALLSRAQVMGFLPKDLSEPVHLDTNLLMRIGAEVEASGVARATVPLFRLEQSKEELEDTLTRMLDAVDASPRPDGEWAPARELLGDELLAQLLGDVSPSSLRRYASGVRATPDEVAWRLHVLARVLASLLGSYNAFGIRRWFARPRTVLNGRTPAEVIREAGHEDDPDLLAVLDLAGGLVGAGAAS
jgi:hypothetical protein